MAIRSKLNQGLEWWQFIPWVVSVSFLLLVIGLIIWASQSARMVGMTAEALADLGLTVQSSLNTWGKAWVGWIATIYALLGTASLSVAVWRRVLKVTSDARGVKAQVSRGWLMCLSVIIGLWWTVMLVLLLIIVGQTMWLVTAYAIDKAAMVGATSVERSMNASHLLPGATSTATSTPPPPTGNGTAGSPPPPALPLTCNSTCVDLSAFDIVLGTNINNTCICNLTKIHLADAQVTDALKAVSGSTVGAVMMFIAATWMLMGAASDHGATRREMTLTRSANVQSDAKGLLDRSKSLFKKGKKGKKQGAGGEEGQDQEMGTIQDDEEGGEGARTSTGGSNPADKSSKGKPLAKSGSVRGGQQSSDQDSLLPTTTSSARSDTAASSSSSPFSLSRASKGISSSFTGAVSSAKKGGTKLFAKALRLGF